MTNCVVLAGFFFERTARRQDCAPFLLVKKEFTSKRSQRSENRSKKKYIIQKYNKRSQAPLKNEARRFAPAIPQARASSLILSGKFMADCSFRWKVHALRSFQISQTTKSIRERNPLRGTRSCSQHQPPLKHTMQLSFGSCSIERFVLLQRSRVGGSLSSIFWL